ncbi:MAG: hypothetical protein ACI94Y_003410 [Maribacter sp.]|jgi:hypothetical protein
MNFHKAKILLEKINRLHIGMSNDPEDISPIEKELMLNYVKDYYEIFYWDKVNAATAIPSPKPTPTKTYPAPKPKKEVVAPTPTPKLKPVVIAAKPVIIAAPKPKPLPVAKEKEVVKETAPNPPVVQKSVEKATPIIKTLTPAPKKEETVKIIKPVQPKFMEKVIDIDLESEALFTIKKGKEISDRLGLSPIMDLNRAFGLNDRMLYTNELFDGDNNVYKETMAVLNSFNSMAQAKIYMIENIVSNYEWTSNGKKKQAKEFIRTISRKYIQT